MSKESQSVTVNITNKTMLRTIVWIVGVILAFRIVENATHALTLIFLSFFLALALNPVVSSIAKHLKISHDIVWRILRKEGIKLRCLDWMSTGLLQWSK